MHDLDFLFIYFNYDTWLKCITIKKKWKDNILGISFFIFFF